MLSDRYDGIEDKIRPIITRTYGDNGMSRALVLHLAGRIEHDWVGYRDRERQIMLTCWNWFSGGTTAESTAHRIEEALNA